MDPPHKPNLMRLSPIGAVMRIVNIHEAKTHLSRLVELAAKGEAFIIAKAGKPMVKVTALEAPAAAQVRRIGFMIGQIAVPDDFDRMGSAKIARLFGDEPA
jgi:antitoxin (DNA-binding transcriptional repressor) of toxin-antitoxin stability system